MGFNSTQKGERTRISIFGLRNAGKSSLINALTGQEVSLVSDVAGTTTDPVSKSMEILPVGPVLITDTPGLDDFGELGEKRAAVALRILDKTDIAVHVVDIRKGLSPQDEEIRKLILNKEIPLITVYSKADLSGYNETRFQEESGAHFVSSKTGQGIAELREKLGSLKPSDNAKSIIEGFVKPGSIAILVTPIDESAPKGRIILPQQQVLRALLDAHCKTFVCQPEELEGLLLLLKETPDIVITDSQVFKTVSEIVPRDIPLTSFSIMFAAYKGDLKMFLEGAEAIRNLKDGDRVLISEACTHHRQCNDIGTVKLPDWITNYTDKKIIFEFTSGGDFISASDGNISEDLDSFALIIHCGGCMISNREMQNRIDVAVRRGIPIVNYGIAIALMKGVLDRVSE